MSQETLLSIAGLLLSVSMIVFTIGIIVCALDDIAATMNNPHGAGEQGKWRK